MCTFTKIFVVLLLVVLLLSITLVSFSNSNTAKFRLEMKANKSSISAGESINFTLSLTNISNQTVTINFTPPLFDILCFSPEGYRYKWSDDKCFIQVLLELTLNPGEKYSKILEWNLYRYENGEYYPPKPGIYRLYGMCMHVGVMCGPINITVKPAQHLILKTDKKTYFLGENVTIILQNIGNCTVDIGGYPAWQIFTYPDEKPVFPEIFAFLAWKLEPGQSSIFIWNQYDEFENKFVEPGTYIIKDTQGWNLSTTFEIVANSLSTGGTSGGRPPLRK